MSQKPKESTHKALLDGTKTKLLVSSNKPWIHDGFLESIKENNRQSLYFISEN